MMNINLALFSLTIAELDARCDVPADVKAEVKRQHLYAEASDLYKSLYGIRCRFMADATAADLIAFIADLSEQARAEYDREIAEEKAHSAAYAAAMQPSIVWTVGLFFPVMPAVGLTPTSANFENSEIAFLCR